MVVFAFYSYFFLYGITVIFKEKHVGLKRLSFVIALVGTAVIMILLANNERRINLEEFVGGFFLAIAIFHSIMMLFIGGKGTYKWIAEGFK